MRPPAYVLLALVVCVACSAPSTPAATPASAHLPETAPGRAPMIRMEIPSAPEISDVPRLMAIDGLRALGYSVEVVEYRDAQVAIQAMLDGALDVGYFPFPQVLAAIQRGAAITSILSAGGSTRVLVTAPEVKQCSDLDKRSVSVPGLISTQTLTLQLYIDKWCPGTNVERVVIAGANNRVAALLARRTAGALLELTNLLELQARGLTQFNELSVFGVEFPGLISAAAVVPRAFFDTYPDTARDIAREWILATRRVQDPAVLKDRIEKYLGLASDQAGIAAKAYLDRKVWDVNGGLSDANLRTSIDFVVKSGVVTPSVTPAEAADLSYLNAVLDVIGRQ